MRSRCRRHDCAESDGFDVADADTRGSKVRVQEVTNLVVPRRM